MCVRNLCMSGISFVGRVAFVAQRPIVVKLSLDDLSVRTYVRASVGRSVGLSSALWKNGGSDPDLVWHHRSDGSRDKAGIGIGPREGVLLGANLGHAIVINGDFTAYMCDSQGVHPPKANDAYFPRPPTGSKGRAPGQGVWGKAPRRWKLFAA